jgi:protein-tyrosine phosphatase
MDPLSRKLLQEGGYNSNLHIARQIDADLCRQADLILAMEKSHIEAIRSFSIEASGKTMLITKWTDNSDIPDPYKKSEELFRLVHQKILDGITAWNKYL